MTLTASATIGDRFAAGSGRFPLSGVQALIRLIVDVRRADRAHRAAVEDLLAHLTEDTLPDCVRIAALPDLVRGYEHIKIASVDRYRTQLHAALAALDQI